MNPVVWVVLFLLVGAFGLGPLILDLERNRRFQRLSREEQRAQNEGDTKAIATHAMVMVFGGLTTMLLLPTVILIAHFLWGWGRHN